MFDALSRKSIPELDALARSNDANADVILLIRDIANLSGGVDALEKIEATVNKLALSNAQRVITAINELRMVMEQIQQRFAEVEIGFDFCELRGYNYHTGILFSAFSADYGYALAKGGRYDDIGKGFGRNSGQLKTKARPATGFSADLKTLARLTGASQRNMDAVFAPMADDALLQDKVRALRAEGYCVVQALSAKDEPADFDCTQHLIMKNGSWQLAEL